MLVNLSVESQPEVIIWPCAFVIYVVILIAFAVVVCSIYSFTFQLFHHLCILINRITNAVSEGLSLFVRLMCYLKFSSSSRLFRPSFKQLLSYTLSITIQLISFYEWWMMNDEWSYSSSYITYLYPWVSFTTMPCNPIFKLTLLSVGWCVFTYRDVFTGLRMANYPSIPHCRNYSLFPIPYSSFPIPYSLFPIYHSLFTRRKRKFSLDRVF